MKIGNLVVKLKEERLGTKAATSYGLVVVLLLTSIISAFGFLSIIHPTLAGVVIGLLVGATGLVIAMHFKQDVQGAGQLLIGAGGVLAGLFSAFGWSFFGITGTQVILVGMGIILAGVGWKYLPKVNKLG